ncbi:MAG: FxsA family protein [Geminicoccaceae bacterium]|nr:MAG: FxsA family protein [Geminicoccaceae bacterium]
MRGRERPAAETARCVRYNLHRRKLNRPTMPLALILLVTFIVVPLIEVALFIQIGGWIGLWPTLLAILLTALVGSVVIRAQGVEVATKARARMDQGVMPLEEGFTGLCLVVAGFLLITPGFFTDAMGAVLLLPPVRHLLYRRVARHVRVVQPGMRPGPGGGRPGGGRPGGDVIDADYEVVEEPPRTMPPPRGGWERRSERDEDDERR